MMEPSTSPSTGRTLRALHTLPSLLAVTAFVYCGGILADTATIEIDCRSDEMVRRRLLPTQDRVVITSGDCHCSSDPNLVKSYLKSRARGELARRTGSEILFPAGLVSQVAELTIDPGETKTIRVYCYSPEQEATYLDSVLEDTEGPPK
jgi:hypothetical protein